MPYLSSETVHKHGIKLIRLANVRLSIAKHITNSFLFV